MPDRHTLAVLFETMPDEAFGYILVGALHAIPAGLGGFRPESRQALEAFTEAAQVYIKAAEQSP